MKLLTQAILAAALLAAPAFATPRPTWHADYPAPKFHGTIEERETNGHKYRVAVSENGEIFVLHEQSAGKPLDLRCEIHLLPDNAESPTSYFVTFVGNCDKIRN